MSKKIIIIGGVAGGASAAAKARRVDEHAEITVFERGPYVSFANCGLPYYVGGEITKKESLLLQSPESFWKRFHIQVKVLHEVLKIDRAKKSVEVKNLTTNTKFSESYDKLILAPGAGAIIPPLPGINLPNIFTVKTVPESEKIKTFLKDHNPKKAVVVGAGFIGLESAEALKRLGLDVTIVEAMPQVLPPFDADMARFVFEHLENSGIHVILSDGIKAFYGEPLAKEFELQSGKRIPMDIAILSIGVRPELKLAQEAGLNIGASGGIAVNTYQQTSDPDIYAAGDAVEQTHLVTGQKTRIPLAGPANKQGRVAGANAAGSQLTFQGSLGTAIVECMGITAAKTGLSEREAEKAGIKSYTTLTHSSDHASYYPGSSLIHMKIIAEKETGRLLGAQIIGEKGVDKRIDVLATALFAKMKVTDLENLDLAYAPQFSSAKDPVIMAGFVASNVMRHESQTISCEILQQKISQKENIQIVDVRNSQEHASGYLPQSLLIPIDELRERIHELDPAKETIVYCKVGLRGYLGARILEQNGFKKVFNLTGGLLSCSPQFQMQESRDITPTQSNTILVSQLKEILHTPNTLTLDVREIDEYNFEHIEGTKNFPYSQIAQNLKTLPKDQLLYVLCQTGIRSSQAVHFLQSAGLSKTYLVEGGISAWKNAGYKIKRSGPFPIMRQVQITAGCLILLGSLIPGMKWLAIFVGVGLVFAGVSGWCGMALLLQKMPWNRSKNKPSSSAGCGTSCSG